jgi:thiamine biosynthesis lipoprotein
MRFIALIWFLSLSFSSSRKASDFETFRIRGFTQGTSYQITYYAKEKTIDKHQVEHILSSIDSSLSIYKPYSLINRFNHSQSGLAMDQHLERVVKKSLEISAKAGTAFDITVLPLVQAWGFGAVAISSLPDSATIQSLLKCVGTEKIRIQQNYLQKASPCVSIDVNGIAQGYSVDVLAKFLEKRGIENYLVEIGGEMRIKGRKQPGGERMSVGIEGPGGDEFQPYPIQAIIQPEYGAITSSGNYRKFYQAGGKILSHLIDPKSGYPIQNEMISVTVWAKDAMSADGYDNALMGMGLEKALKFAAQQEELEAFFIYQKADGTVTDTASLGFYQLMK